MNGLRLLTSAAIVATLLGCEQTPGTANQDAINESGFFAKFSPSDSIIPFPNNVLFAGSVDGTLEIPLPTPTTTPCNNAGEIALKTALNDLDGFSTTAPILTTFTSAVDTDSLVIGDSIRVFEVTLSGTGGVVTGITRELDSSEVAVGVSSVDNEILNADCDSESLGENTLVISPLKPLAANTSYLVALTKSVKGPLGNNAAADTVYAFTKSSTPLTTTFDGSLSGYPTALSEVTYSALKTSVDLDGDDVIDVDLNGDTVIDAIDDTIFLTSMGDLDLLRFATVVSENAVVTYTITDDLVDMTDDIPDLAASDIVLSWAFTTQSVGDVLGALQTVVDSGAQAAVLNDITSETPAAAADIYAGTLTTNYYLNEAASVNDPSPLSGSWRGAGDTPLTKFNTAVNPPAGTTDIPLLATIPKTTMPGAGWPVVIFQHGITRNRADILTIADAMAGQNIAVVAIDMPLHGLTNDETDGTQAFYMAGLERTFDLDLVDNETSAAGPDTVTDLSGTHYINLNSLLTTRDNVRQSVADLYVLRKALETLTTTTGGHSFDASKIYFVGHSMGGIAGSVFLATDSNVKSSVLAMAGGGIAKLLDGSAAFGPTISAGLGVNGVNKGFAQYESFMASAQMLIDSADPINYASAASTGRGILFFEVVGDGADNLPDQTIPNNVIGVTDTVDAPLSGSDPLITGMALTQMSASDTAANLMITDIDAVVKFTGGHHGSILTTNDADDNADATSASVTTEMQTEMALFIKNDGASLTIVDDTVIEAAP